MKILLCSIAIRAEPATFPPVACTSLINLLLKNGYQAKFYDIDAKRPSPEELYSFFKARQFDLVGISAVVSTGYKYVKDLSVIIKRASAHTQIILGGNLAAAYKIILQKTKVDICVIGEGERPLLGLVRHYEKYADFKPSSPDLYDIKGITFLGLNGMPEFTGHQCGRGDSVSQPDYELLQRFSDINHYILDPYSRTDFAYDQRSYAARRRGKKLATVFTSKGCINCCTFCHRWVKGYRIAPVKDVIGTMKELIDKFNVGFFCLSDECFGENKGWLNEFIESIRPLDVLFQIGAARVTLLKQDQAIIRRLKEVGLTAIYFGMESGSDKMLSIMEKNATAAENLLAAKICAQAGVYTSIQLVIGMPGENERTINKTIEFVKSATGNLPYPPQLSVNYLQALPGTPAYEFLRKHGFLGNTIEDEERYLIGISNINACEYRQYINVSEEPSSKAALWQKKIYFLVKVHWFKKNGYPFLDNKLFPEYRSVEPVNTKYVKRLISYKAKFFLLNSKMVPYEALNALISLFWLFLLLKERYFLYGIRKTCLIALGIIKDEDRYSYQKKGKFSLKQLIPDDNVCCSPLTSDLD